MAATFFGLTNTTLNFDTSSTNFYNIRPKDEDCIFLDNSKLIIDSDNRWGYNGFLFSLIAETSYGDFLIDGRNVWEIPFSSSSGYVPMLSAIEHSSMKPVSGTTSGAYGELLNVWNNTSFSPLTASSYTSTVLPVSGWIKLRSKTGNFIAGETIKLSNGSTIVASTSGKRSWINIAAARTYHHPRYGRRDSYIQLINAFSTLSAVGDWYYLDETTNGKYNQQLRVPVQDILYGAWIEDAPNSNNYVQYHNACSMWNLTAQEVGGTVIGNLSSNGFFFSQDYVNQTITLASSASNGFCGYLSPSGCRIKIPNIFLSVVTKESNGTYSTNSTLLRYGAVIYNHSNQLSTKTLLKYCNSNWRCLDSQSGGEQTIENSCFCTGQYFNGKVNIINSICGPGPLVNGSQGSIASNFGPGIVTSFFSWGGDIKMIGSSVLSYRSESGSDPEYSVYSWRGLNSDGITGNPKSLYIKDSRFTDGSYNEDGSNRGTINAWDMEEPAYLENLKIIGKQLSFDGSDDITIKNIQLGTRLNGKIDLNYWYNGFVFNDCKNVTVDGVYSFPELQNVVVGKSDNITKHFHYRLFHATLCDNVTLKNVGTYTTPLTCHNQYSYNGNWGVCRTDTNSKNIKYQNIHLVCPKFFNTDDDSQGYSFGLGANNILVENVYVYDSAIKLKNQANNQQIDSVLFYNSAVRSFYAELPMENINGTRAAAHGTHWINSFTSPTSGILLCYTTKSTDKTKPYITENFQQTPFKSGYNPNGVNSGNYLYLSNIGDYIISETPYYILGITGFLDKLAVSFTNPIYYIVSSGFEISFQYDIWGNNTYNGTWLSLPLAGRVNRAGYLNVQNLTGIQIDPNIGIKLKIRASSIVNSTANSIDYVALYTKTDPVSQQILYPAAKDTQGIIKNLIQGTRVQIFNVTKNQELFNGIHTAVGDFIYEYTNGIEIGANDIIRIRLVYVNGAIAKKRQQLNAVGSETGFSLYVIQEDDVVYNTFGIIGSTVAEFSADYPNIEVNINDSDRQTSIPRLYAWWVANENTLEGIRNYFGGIIAEDFANYRVITEIVEDFKLDNLSNQGVVFLGNYRLYRDDGGVPVVTTTTGGGSIILYAGNVNVTTVDRNVPSLTPQESATLSKINTIPQDTFNLALSSIPNNNSIGARLKNSATVSNVAQIIADSLSI